MYKMVQEDTKFPLVRGESLRNSRRRFWHLQRLGNRAGKIKTRRLSTAHRVSKAAASCLPASHAFSIFNPSFLPAENTLYRHLLRSGTVLSFSPLAYWGHLLSSQTVSSALRISLMIFFSRVSSSRTISNHRGALGENLKRDSPGLVFWYLTAQEWGYTLFTVSQSRVEDFFRSSTTVGVLQILIILKIAFVYL